jgi:hypothetical protein
LPWIAKSRGATAAGGDIGYCFTIVMIYDRGVGGNPAADTSENEP